MCLAVPVKVVETDNGGKAKVEVDGVKLDVATVLVTDLKVGDWVLVHAGFIIERITDDLAQQKIDLFNEFYQKTGQNKRVN